MRNAEKDRSPIFRIRLASILTAVATILATALPAFALSFNVYLGRDITGKETELSQYDLLVLSPRVLREPVALRNIRLSNPDIQLYMIFDLLSGNDGNVNFLAQDFSQDIEPEWKMRSTTGEILSTWPETYICNLTEHCPRVNGIQYRDYAIKYLEKNVLPLMGEFDGLFLDECIESILWIDGSFDGDFDLNNDRMADHPDSVHVWVARGWESMLDDIRERHPDLPIIGNGNNHFFSQLNGRMFEDFPNSSFDNILGGMAQLETWRMNQDNPICLLNATAESGNDTERRAGWALGNFSGQYLGFDGGPWEHNHLQWSELFDYDLGTPEDSFRVEGSSLLSRDYDVSGGNDEIFAPVQVRWVHADEAISGDGALELTSGTKGWQPLISMDLDSYGGGQEVIVSFRYHVIDAPGDGVKLYQAFRGHDGDGSEKVSLPSRIVHEGEYGYVLAEGHRALGYRGDYFFYLAVSDGSTIVIDELSVLTKRSAHIRQSFDGGVLVHSLSSQSMQLDMFDQWHPDPSLAFSGTWYQMDRGELMLRGGETLVLLPGSIEPGVPSDSEGSIDSESESGDGQTSLAQKPRGAQFQPAFPNPFNPKVSIPFSLDRDERVRAAVYDLQGRLVSELADDVFSAGQHMLEWRGESDRGGNASSGVYFLRLESDRGRSVQKLVLAS